QTDPQGRYLIEGIPLTTEKITMTASRDGLFAAQATVPGFHPGEPQVILDLQLQEGFVLKGQVVDEDDRPVPGAKIIFGTHSTSGTRFTDQQGRFVLEGASEMIETLLAQKKGFAPGRIFLVDLPPEERESLRIVLRPGHSIAGIVTDTKGNPIGGAYVSPWIGTSTWVRTDAEGRFFLEDLPGTLRFLSVNKEGYVETRIEDVTVDRDDVHIVLEEPGQIVGIAVDKSTGAPVHPITVSLSVAKEVEGKGTTFFTDRLHFDSPDGAFRFWERIKTGERCKVSVTAEDYSEAELEGVEAWPLSESRDPIRVELEKGGVLVGCVVDGASGSPLEGVTVSHRVDQASIKRKNVRRYWPCSDYGGLGTVKSAVTDGRGEFQLKGIPDSAGSIFLEKEGYARKATFPVRPGPGLQVFELAPSAALEGSVQTKSGKPIPQAWLRLSVNGLVFPYAQTNKEGHYRIDDLPAGDCEVTMERRSADPRMRARPKAAVLTAGEVTVVNFTDPGGSIAGKVTTRGGKPIPGALVHAKSLTNWREPRYVMAVDDGGAFHIGGVPAGPYDLLVELPGRRADLPEGARKQIEVGSDETICNFFLDP
ncbi:MAG: carboxypeptidase regulatory-like domain-containing protein, partial [Deltaproteobacteria bacterium]